MSSAERQPLHLVVGATRLWCDAADPSLSSWSIAVGANERPDAALDRALHEFGAALKAAGVRRSRLRSWVSDRWYPLGTVPWSPAFAGSQEAARGHAAEQLRAAGHRIEPDATLRVDDANRYGEPRIAVAYPAGLLDGLSAIASGSGARLESIGPLEVAMARSAMATSGSRDVSVALLEDTRLRFVHRYGGSLTAGQSLSDDAFTDGDCRALSAAWRRQRLRQPLLAPSVHVLGVASAWQPQSSDDTSLIPQAPRTAEQGTLPPGLHSLIGHGGSGSLDAIARTSAHRGVLLATGACLVAAAVLGVQALRFGEAANVGDAQRARAAQTVAPPPATWSRDELARVRSVNAAIRELNFPIGTLLQSILPPRDIPVALLGIDVEPGRSGEAGRLKLHAEASTGEDMANYVSHLAQRPTLTRAYLVSHAVDGSGQDARYRFGVEIQWRD